MKLILTGGLGHIGSKLLRSPSILNTFKSVVIIDNLGTERYSSLFNLTQDVEFKLITHDIRSLNLEDFPELNDSDVLIHLAALTNPAALQGDNSKALESNFEATQAAVKIAGDLNCSLIFSSSTSIYSAQDGAVNEETRIVQTNSTYSKIKLEEEQLILGANLKRSVILRLGTIAGVSSGMRFHTAVNKFCFDALVNREVKVWKGAMDLSRPYLSLNDAAIAFSYMSTQDDSAGIYNLATCSMTVREMLEKIEHRVSRAFKILEVESPYEPEKNFIVETSKIRDAGVELRNNIDGDIDETIEILRGFNGKG